MSNHHRSVTIATAPAAQALAIANWRIIQLPALLLTLILSAGCAIAPDAGKSHTNDAPTPVPWHQPGWVPSDPHEFARLLKALNEQEITAQAFVALAAPHYLSLATDYSTQDLYYEMQLGLAQANFSMALPSLALTELDQSLQLFLAVAESENAWEEQRTLAALNYCQSYLLMLEELVKEGSMASLQAIVDRSGNAFRRGCSPFYYVAYYFHALSALGGDSNTVDTLLDDMQRQADSSDQTLMVNLYRMLVAGHKGEPLAVEQYARKVLASSVTEVPYPLPQTWRDMAQRYLQQAQSYRQRLIDCANDSHCR